MKQAKPASGGSVRPPHGSHLPRPEVPKAGVRRIPDPEGHARALIRAHGLAQAAAIAANNAAFTRENYWREVSAAICRILDAAGEQGH